MVRFEETGDGLVHLLLCPPHADTDEADYFRALGLIGMLDKPYAMVVDIAGHSHLSREGEIRQAAWAKETRAQVSRFCQALALVREHPNPRSQQSFARLWSIPVHVTSDRDDAIAFALSHLLKENARP
ncbi:hypothetical protein ASC97_13890 [Rhizobium sp. Root1203]|uniref:hypothetical protein n=1 Tax=Rhizobium sp. Root1203 TaxID=1736427 RepID=UPI00070D6E96|nr:hypothetical protein [Rhizobium sp. Root1203]KQV12245.1 hypothetical protein ASC97_13890 [Rhizobium sp. Root1203]